MFKDYRAYPMTHRVYLSFKIDAIYKLSELKYRSTYKGTTKKFYLAKKHGVPKKENNFQSQTKATINFF